MLAKSKKLNLYLETETVEKMGRLSKKQGLSRSQFVGKLTEEEWRRVFGRDAGVNFSRQQSGDILLAGDIVSAGISDKQGPPPVQQSRPPAGRRSKKRTSR